MPSDTTYSEEDIKAVSEAVSEHEIARKPNADIKNVRYSLTLGANTTINFYIYLAENYTGSIKVDDDKLMYGLYGLILKPADTNDGQIELFCIDGFGVCGTGLETEEITLAGYTAYMGTFDEHEHWDYILKFRQRHSRCTMISFLQN